MPQSPVLDTQRDPKQALRKKPATAGVTHDSPTGTASALAAQEPGQLERMGPANVLALQQTAGNRAVSRMAQTRSVHPISSVQRAGGTPGIQRWGIKVGGGVAGLTGHEALTEVAMDDFKAGLKRQIEELQAQAAGEEGEQRQATEQRIRDLRLQLLSPEEIKGLTAGSRWNDMLHNSTVAGLGMEIHKEGSLTNASHEGQLQFLHSMASAVADEAWQTRHKIIMWAEFCFKVGTGLIPVDRNLNTITENDVSTERDFVGGPTIAQLFANWGNFSVGWLFTGSTKPATWTNARSIAIGSMLHMLQDSFCMSHAQREAGKRRDAQARLIKGFNVYTQQDGGPSGRHANADVVQGHGWTSQRQRVAMTAGAQEAVDMGSAMIAFWKRNADWGNVRPYLSSILGLAPELEAQQPANGQWPAAQTPDGKRIVSASGRLFRNTLIFDQFKQTFGRTSYFEPREVTNLRTALSQYNAQLSKELSTLTVNIPIESRLTTFLDPQLKALKNALHYIPTAYFSIENWKKIETDREKFRRDLMAIDALLAQDKKEIEMDINAIRDARRG